MGVGRSSRSGTSVSESVVSPTVSGFIVGLRESRGGISGSVSLLGLASFFVAGAPGDDSALSLFRRRWECRRRTVGSPAEESAGREGDEGAGRWVEECC